MAYVIIKSDERRQKEKQVLKEFGGVRHGATAEQKEYAETIVAKIKERGTNDR